MPIVRRVEVVRDQVELEYLRPNPTTGLYGSTVAIPDQRGWWLERVLDDGTVLRWPRCARCVEEADDLEAALVGVADDHPSWRRT